MRVALSSVSEDFDIIVLVETWLNDSISDAELGFEDYCVYRQDRNSANSSHLRGGGVLIAVRKNLLSRMLRVTVSDVEQLFVEVGLKNKHLIVGSVYLPPNSDLFVYETHCLSVEEVMKLSPNADILIMGDYNLPHVVWHNNNGYLSYDIDQYGHFSSQANTLLHFLNLFNLYQHNSVVNANRNTLDLVFSTLPHISISPAAELLCLCDSPSGYCDVVNDNNKLIFQVNIRIEMEL